MDETGNDIEKSIELLDEKLGRNEGVSFIAKYRDLLTKAITTVGEMRQASDPNLKIPNLKKVINTYEKNDPLVELFYEKISQGADYNNIVEARKEAEEIMGEPVKAGTVNVKVVDEAMERAVVLAARDIASSPLSDSEKYRQLVDLYKRHPILGSRTSTSSIEQAFSTPGPLAFIASRAAKVKAGDIVYDSAAGNGMLLIEAELDKAFANEMNPNRSKSLQELGVGTVTKQDANEIKKSEPVDKVIINPPFGKLKEGIAQQKKSWTVDGVTTMEIDHAISLKTLQSLKPNGKAVLIIGAKGFKNFDKPAQRAKSYRNQAVIGFYDKLYDSFNVTDHYTVDGGLYAKQGASFPVDVIVIDGKGKSKRPKPYNVVGGGVPELIKDWETLENEKLNKTPKLAVEGKAESLESDQSQLDSDSRGDSRGDERTDDGGLPIPDEKIHTRYWRTR